MRIFDRIASGEPVFDLLTELPLPSAAQAEWRKAAHQAVRIIADEAAQFVYQSNRIWDLDSGDFGTQVPPFRECWIEWKTPKWRFINGKWSDAAGVISHAQRVISTRYADGTWEVTSVGLCAGTRIVTNFATMTKHISSDGHTTTSLLNFNDDDLARFRESIRGEYVGLNDAALVQGEALEWWPTHLALGWINTRNGGTYEASVDRTTLRRRKKKRQFAGLDYRRIVLDERTVAALEQNLSRMRNGLPLHHVRGHFATYTKERPLFGTWVGRLWRDGHQRGNPSKGAIHHEYHVTSEAAQ